MPLFLLLGLLLLCVNSQSDQATILNKHAAERAVYGLPPLTWDSKLAQVAKAYASKCNWNHNAQRTSDYSAVGGSGYVGENIAASSGQSVGIDGWISEKSDWTCSDNSCRNVCGHYTQMIWSSTTLIGCAVQDCTSGSPFGTFNNGQWQYLVCNYAVGGNMAGQSPVSSCSVKNPVPIPVPVPVPQPKPLPVPLPKPVPVPVPVPVTVPKPIPKPVSAPVSVPVSVPVSTPVSTPVTSCTDIPTPRVTYKQAPAPCTLVKKYEYCYLALPPYCQLSCRGCSGSAAATDTITINENSGNDSIEVQTSAVPGWGVTLIVLASVVVTLLIVLVVMMALKKPQSERF